MKSILHLLLASMLCLVSLSGNAAQWYSINIDSAGTALFPSQPEMTSIGTWTVYSFTSDTITYQINHQHFDKETGLNKDKFDKVFKGFMDGAIGRNAEAIDRSSGVANGMKYMDMEYMLAGSNDPTYFVRIINTDQDAICLKVFGPTSQRNRLKIFRSIFFNSFRFNDRRWESTNRKAPMASSAKHLGFIVGRLMGIGFFLGIIIAGIVLLIRFLSKK
jgi:hypothetical protein